VSAYCGSEEKLKDRNRQGSEIGRGLTGMDPPAPLSLPLSLSLSLSLSFSRSLFLLSPSLEICLIGFRGQHLNIN